MFKKKKKSPLAESFKDLIHIKLEINRIKKEIDSLGRFDEDYHENKEKLEDELKEFFEVREIIESKFFRENGDMYLGTGCEIRDIKEAPEEIPIIIKEKDRHGHFSIQGTTRVGKSVLMLNAHIRQNIMARENVICVDPKGGQEQEVFTAMVEFAYEADMLKFFKYYSLAYPELSDRLNPFFGMNDEERASLVASISSIGNSEQFFTDVVYQLTYAVSICLKVIEFSLDPYGEITDKLIVQEQLKMEEARRNKGYLRELMDKNENLFAPDEMDIATAPQKPSSSKEDEEANTLIQELKDHNSTLMTFRDLAKYVTYSSLEGLQEEVAKVSLSSDITDEDIIAEFEKIQYSAEMEISKILDQPKDFYTKISISLATLLTQMSQGAMGDIFCSVKINPLLADLSADGDATKRVIALLHPFPLRFKKISDMSSRIFMLTIENMLGRIGSTGRGFNARLNIHVDEAASVAYPGIERLPAQAGGLGATLYYYTQSFSDWVKALGSQEAANIMLDNLNNQIRFRMKDESSADRVVMELGDIEVTTSSAMIEASGEARMVLGSERKWFTKTSDILKMPIGRFILTSGDKSYLVDAPFWSGTSGEIIMPEIKIERKIRKLKEFEDLMEETLVAAGTIHDHSTIISRGHPEEEETVPHGTAEV